MKQNPWSVIVHLGSGAIIQGKVSSYETAELILNQKEGLAHLANISDDGESWVNMEKAIAVQIHEIREATDRELGKASTFAPLSAADIEPAVIETLTDRAEVKEP